MNAEQLELTVEPRKLARRTDPETSHAAARALTTQHSHCAKLLAWLREHPSTSEEAGRATGIERHAAARRVPDLVKLGLVEDSGERRRGKTGREQIVWKVVEQ